MNNLELDIDLEVVKKDIDCLSEKDLVEIYKFVELSLNKFDDKFVDKVSLESNRKFTYDPLIQNISGISNIIVNEIQEKFNIQLNELIKNIKPNEFDLNNFKIAITSNELNKINKLVDSILQDFGNPYKMGLDSYFKEMIISTILLKSKIIDIESYINENALYKLPKNLMKNYEKLDINGFKELFDFLKVNGKDSIQGPRSFYDICIKYSKEIENLPKLDDILNGFKINIESNKI